MNYFRLSAFLFITIQNYIPNCCESQKKKLTPVVTMHRLEPRLKDASLGSASRA